MARLFKPAKVFHPGEYLRDELQARGWSQATFAKIIGRPLQTVNQIINGRKSLTAQTAAEIATAFGTSPQTWMNLQATYDLAKVKLDPRIEKRAASAA